MGIIKSLNFKYQTLFYTVFEQNYTELHQTLDDVHIKLGQKQITMPDCMNNVNLQPDFSGKVGDRYERI